MDMTVVSEAPEAMVLAFNGRLDLNGVNQIDHCFKEKVAAAANVVVQMQEVTFLASLGMRMLMMAAKTLKAHSLSLNSLMITASLLISIIQ